MNRKNFNYCKAHIKHNGTGTWNFFPFRCNSYIMSSRYFTVFLVLGIVLLNFCSVSGQSASGDSLISYMETAAKNNPLVLQRFSEYQAALQKIPQAGSLPDPELSLGVFLTPMEIISGKQVADVRLMQMFPWFGVLKNAKDEMSLMAKAKFESFRDAKLGVCFDVQRNWYDLFRLKQDLVVSDDNLSILKTLERLSLVRFRASGGGGNSEGSMTKESSQVSEFSSGDMQSMGASSGSRQSSSTNQSTNSVTGNPMVSSQIQSGLTDVYRIQIEIGNLENDREGLLDQQNTVLSWFNALLNRPPLTPVSLPDSLHAEVLDIALNVIPDSMLEGNPMLGMLHYEAQSIEAKQKMVKRMGYPMVGLGIDYSLISKSAMSTSPMNGKDMLMPMVTVTLPIYRKKYRAMQKETEWMQKANGQEIQSTVNSLQTQYFEAVQQYSDASRRVGLYQKQIGITRKTFDIMLKGYASGGSRLSEVLDISRQLLDYRYKEVEALADYNTAIAALKRLMASSAATQNYNGNSYE